MKGKLIYILVCSKTSTPAAQLIGSAVEFGIVESLYLYISTVRSSVVKHRNMQIRAQPSANVTTSNTFM